MTKRDKISMFLLCLMSAILILAGIKSVWEINYKFCDAGNQVAWVIACIVLSMNTTSYLRKVCISLGILSFGETIDELRGKNADFHINDYVLLVLVIIWTLYLINKQWKIGKQKP